jgi:hypothetical protein
MQAGAWHALKNTLQDRNRSWAHLYQAVPGKLLPRRAGSRDDGDECAERLGATMETVVVWILASLLYWWGLL